MGGVAIAHMERERWMKAGGGACVTTSPNSDAQLCHAAVRSNTAARGLAVRPTYIKPAPWWSGPSALFGRLIRDSGESQRLVDQGGPSCQRAAPGHPGRPLHPPHGLCRGAAWVMSFPQNLTGP